MVYFGWEDIDNRNYYHHLHEFIYMHNRRQFIQTSTILFAGSLIGSGFTLDHESPLLSFSTLGCPDWPFDKIMEFAVANNYKGIEVRGIQRQMDLTKCPEFDTVDHRAATMKKMAEKGLSFVNLGSSANLHLPESAERQKNLEEAKRFIDLAQQINCPSIRVFPNNFPKDQEKVVTMDLIVRGLLELGNYAKDKKVTVLMESHGDLVKIEDLLKVMSAARHPNVGLIWDVSNMWCVTRESPKAAWTALKPYIKHTHIKDAKLVDDKPQYVLLGEGDVPIFEAIDVLSKDKYKGFYSFEWEKLWHPEIQEPDIAIADYPKKIKQHLNH